mmetsp:Transcript_18995/g.34407  ORF Transcript_18995/g.34407 Transcript_18995/m.34407 type:complete len:86 (+) Transcript_18995:1915-2172(+)
MAGYVNILRESTCDLDRFTLYNHYQGRHLHIAASYRIRGLLPKESKPGQYRLSPPRVYYGWFLCGNHPGSSSQACPDCLSVHWTS